MAELVEDLEALLEGRKPAALARLPAEPRHRLRRTAGAVAIMSIVAIAGLALWLTRSAWLPSSELVAPVEAEVPAPPPPPRLVGHPLTLANGGPGRVLLILPNDWFIEDHYTGMENALKSRGITFAIASTKAGTAKPKHNAIPPVPVDLTLDKFDVHDFDGVVFVGGNPFEFTKHKTNGERARQIVTTCLDKGKPVAALEVAITILDDAGFTSECTFEQKGGCYLGRSPRRTGVLVTTKDHKYARELVQEMFP
jgi:putative intracellular protease/amidase